MGEVAQLITALAALVTAIGGASAGIIVAVRSSGRQRYAAAEEATRLVITPGRGRDGPHRHRADRDGRVARELADRYRHLAAEAGDLARDTGRESRLEHLEHHDGHSDGGDGRGDLDGGGHDG